MRTAFLLCAFCLPVAANDAAAVKLSSGCSGVCVSADGLILTADHCGDDRRVDVTFADGQQFEAVAVYLPPLNGIDEAQAYRITTDKPLPFAAISSTPAKAGDSVSAVGYPAGNYQKNAGKVLRVGFGTKARDGFSVKLADGLVTNWASDGGNSGGPLFNASGEVVGLLSMSATDEPRSYWIGTDSIGEAVKRAEQPATAYRRADVIVFTTDGCAACDRLQSDVRAGRFAAYQFQFVKYDRTLRKWSDKSLAKEFADTAKAPAGLGFPVIWVRGSTNYRTGYEPNQRSGLLGWLTRVVTGLATLIIGEETPPPFPPIEGEAVPVPDGADAAPAPVTVPTPIDATKLAVEKLRGDLIKAKADVEKLKSANPITKLKGVVALKSDVAGIKADARAALDQVKIVKEDAKEKPLQYLWGVLGIITGLAHRRFAA